MLRLARVLRAPFGIAALIIGLVNTMPVHALSACQNNVIYPRLPPEMCPETIINYPFAPGIAAITALTFGPDGSLYFARPATSEIVRLKPDADGFLSAPYPPPQVFASHLPEPPNGLTYFEGAWYVSGDTTITRLRDTTGSGTTNEQQIIVRDLPGGVGGWLGNIRAGAYK